MDTPTNVNHARSWQHACTTKVPHDDRCRDRTGELMVPEADVQHPEAREEMDVSEPTVRVDVPAARPAPTYQEGGSSGSG